MTTPVAAQPRAPGFTARRQELVKRWYPDLQPPQKSDTHRALDDIRESIAELHFYRAAVFR